MKESTCVDSLIELGEWAQKKTVPLQAQREGPRMANGTNESPIFKTIVTVLGAIIVIVFGYFFHDKFNHIDSRFTELSNQHLNVYQLIQELHPDDRIILPRTIRVGHDGQKGIPVEAIAFSPETTARLDRIALTYNPHIPNVQTVSFQILNDVFGVLGSNEKKHLMKEYRLDSEKPLWSAAYYHVFDQISSEQQGETHDTNSETSKR